jgi:hypothetical protein
VIKLQIIKQLIQIERPKNWTEEDMKNLIRETYELEKFNCNRPSLVIHKSKWQPILNTLKIYN